LDKQQSVFEALDKQQSAKISHGKIRD